MDKKKSESIVDDIFGLASNLAGDIVKSNTKKLNFGTKQTAFGELIDSHQKQIKLVSKTYEDEIVSLVDKMDDLSLIMTEFEDKIVSLEAEKKNLEELLGKYQEESTKEEPKEESVEKDAGKKSKPKVSK